MNITKEKIIIETPTFVGVLFLMTLFLPTLTFSQFPYACSAGNCERTIGCKNRGINPAGVMA
ncbi:MAG: hypothetical protein PHQ96_02810 [Candidatus Omnitrophica bacterium]|nr:hypothetical protein [Candidatus Omnitrophota bacterium]